MKTSRATIKRLAAIADHLPVVIPEVLIERLKPYGTKRFIKVASPQIGNSASGKAAIERAWQERLYEPDDASLQEWLRSGGNYGVAAGQNIIIIDFDDKETAAKLAAIKTFTIRSGSGRGLHLLLRSDATENAVIIANGKNLGNVQVKTKYVVGAGSRHNTGGEYKVVDDAPIAYVSKAELDRMFGAELHWTGQIRTEEEKDAEETAKKIGVTIPIDKVIDITKLQQRGTEYQGSHPLHGSTSGTNFNVNLQKNIWHCWRCNSGGDALQWIAIEAGIIRCDESHPGVLRDTKFIEALNIAKERGFDVKLTNKELNPDVARFFKEDKWGNLKFIPARVARELMDENRYLTQITRKKEGMMFRYNSSNGIYEPDAESYINAQTIKKLGEAYDINKQNQIKAFIEGSTYTEIPETSKELIATKNGVVNVVTLEFFSFNPDYYIFNAIPVTYDPNAKCPLFLAKLSEWVPTEGARRVLQEHAGHCLFKDNKAFQRALMLIGLRQNGKSTWLHTINKMLGEENVSAVALDVLSDTNRRFAISQLYNKLANICADLPPKPLKETDTFKKAVSGDPIEGEFKFQQEFTFTSYAKLLFSANELPPMPKDVEAFMVRWDIVNFPNSFMPGDPRRDPELLKKLTTPTELSGILNWALEGLQRLLKDGHFSENRTMEDAVMEWSIRSDALKVFVEQNIAVQFEEVTKETADTDFEIAESTTDEVYSRYLAFCKRYKVMPLTSSVFARRFAPISGGRYHSTTRNGESVRVWQGIRLRKQNTENT